MNEIKRLKHINVIPTVRGYIMNSIFTIIEHFFYPHISSIPLSTFLPHLLVEVRYSGKFQIKFIFFIAIILDKRMSARQYHLSIQ